MMLQLLPVAAYLFAIVLVVAIAVGRTATPGLRWGLPALLGLLFVAFSLLTVLQDGLLQFWVNHTTNFAGNQVWFDLVMAVVIAFYLIAPRARAVGMPLLPWGIAVIATACIALLPMLARLLWLEQRKTAHV
ncbi:MAG: hypothetical protein AAGK71_06590 [Pseudomonadota bacterium]